MSRLLLLALMLGATGFGYGRLLDYDPFSKLRLREVTDAWFFAPSVASPKTICALALLVFAFRCARRRGNARALPLAVLSLGLVAVSFAGWSSYVGAPRALAPSLSALFLAASAACFGRAGFAIAWPSALLVQLAAPLPGVLVQTVMLDLQLATADATAGLLTILGTPASAIGDVIYTSQRTYQIIESCSGLRGLQSLSIGAFVVYFGALDRTPVRAAGLVASSVPIALAANLARCVAIALHPDSEIATVHETQGWAMFTAGAIGVAIVDRLSSRAHRASSGDTPAGPPQPPLPNHRQLLIAFALCASVAAMRAIPRIEQPPPAIPSIHDVFPIRLGPWTSSMQKVDRRFLGSVGFSERISRRYSIPGQRGEVDCFAGIDLRDQPEWSLISPKTRLPGSGWWIEERSAALLDGAISAERLVLRAPNGGRWVGLHWTSGTSSPWVEILRAHLALDLGPLRRRDPALVARVITPVASETNAAEALVRSFVPDAQAALARLRPSLAPGE